MQVKADADKGHRAKQQAICTADPHLLEDKAEFLAAGNIFIHQNTDRNSQGLCTDISGHVKNQRLEAHHDRDLGHYSFKHADHARHHKAKSKQQHQPRHTFAHAFLQGFLQILLRSKTCQLCVILTHLVIDSLDDVVRRDDTDDLLVIIQDRDGILRVILQVFDYIRNLCLRMYARVAFADDIIKRHIISCNDQILQFKCTGVFAVLVYYINGIDIVIVVRLFDNGPHRFLDRKTFRNRHVVRGHHAADLVFLEGLDQSDILSRILIHHGDQLLLLLLVIEIFQSIDRIVGVHVFEDVRRLLQRQLFQIFRYVINIRKNFGYTLHTENSVQLLSALGVQLLQRFRNVVFMVIIQRIADFLVRLSALDDLQNLFRTCQCVHLICFHGFLPPFSVFSENQAMICSDKSPGFRAQKSIPNILVCFLSFLTAILPLLVSGKTNLYNPLHCLT